MIVPHADAVVPHYSFSESVVGSIIFLIVITAVAIGLSAGWRRHR